MAHSRKSTRKIEKSRTDGLVRRGTSSSLLLLASHRHVTCSMKRCVGLLFVLAHPDDETFLAGGTIAKYAQAGVRVAVVCGTRGERGSTADLCPIDALPAQRESELREAARILGIAEVELLGYVDQQLAAAP